MGRTAERHNLEPVVRLQLIEKDADQLESGLAAITERLSKILWAVVGLLITVTTSSIFLALNLVVN